MKYKKMFGEFWCKILIWSFGRSGRTHKDIINNKVGQMGHEICGLQSVMNRDQGRTAVKIKMNLRVLQYSGKFCTI
jgi:hypothetical protein